MCKSTERLPDPIRHNRSTSGSRLNNAEVKKNKSPKPIRHMKSPEARLGSPKPFGKKHQTVIRVGSPNLSDLKLNF